MRFIIAIILTGLLIFIALATSPGVGGIDMLVSYMLGMVLAPVIIASLFCIPKSGRNNKRFFKAYNILVLMAIFGQFGKLNEVIQSANKPPQTVGGSNNNIELTIPGSWSIKESPNESVVMNLSDGSGYLNVVVSYEYAGDERFELEHYAQLVGNNFKERAPGLESSSEFQECGSTKLQCVYQIVKTTGNEKGTKTVLASLNGKDGYYNFIAITNPGLFDRYKDDIFNALISLTEV